MLDVFSRASITPSEVWAGDSEEFIIRLTVGNDYTPGPSRLILDFMCMLGASCPTTEVNEASGYVEVYVDNPDVTYVKHCWSLETREFETRGVPTPREGQRLFVLDLSEGLKAGDVIEVHWGETLGGFGPGAKVTTVVPRTNFENRVDVRYFENQNKGLPDLARSFEGYDRPTPDAVKSLAYRIKARHPHHLRLIRKPHKSLLVPYDRFWNVADVAEAGDIVNTEPEIPVRNPEGVFEYQDKHIAITTKGLPLTQSADMADVHDGYNLYWGDVHTHSIHSCDVLERSAMDMTPADLMVFARDRAGLDFFSVTDHHQPSHEKAYHIGRDRWNDTLEAIRTHDKPGEFAVIAGSEWRDARGDTVLLYNWLPEYDEITNPKLEDIRDLWRAFEGKNFISIPHLHNGGWQCPGRLRENEWWVPRDLERMEPVLEMFSDHGSYEREDVLENGRALCKRFRPDQSAMAFLKKGIKYGFVGSSDDHKGHVGVNGLTAVFARSLDKDALFDAYRSRRVYCTTNARIRLVFTGNGALMGSVVRNETEKRLLIDVVGENRLKRVDLFRNGDLYKRYCPEGLAFKQEAMIREDEPSNWYVRVTQLDNHIAYSSPIWFE